MDPQIDIYYVAGSFLVYDTQHAIELRQRKFTGKLIGCSPKNPHQIDTAGLPYLINHYAAKLIAKDGIARFKKFIPRDTIDGCYSEYKKKLEKLKQEAKEQYLADRTRELTKRGIPVTENKLDNFDETKLRLVLNHLPDPVYSTHESACIDQTELEGLFNVSETKWLVYENLSRKGFYVSSGGKFGCDFLIYDGDPVRYHARYALRIMTAKSDFIDLTQVNHNEINAFHRLCHSAKKLPLFAVIFANPDDGEVVKYWTLKPREYLKNNSDSSTFAPIELSPSMSVDNLRTATE